jgi:hypothetical protein
MFSVHYYLAEILSSKKGETLNLGQFSMKLANGNL